MTHKEYADSLRRVASFIEAHTELPVPASTELTAHPLGKVGLAEYARAFGRCEKVFTDTFVYVRKDFGAIVLQALDWRSQVCERVVVATEEIPEEIVPEKVIPAHIKEIVEWKCPESLLEAAQ